MPVAVGAVTANENTSVASTIDEGSFFENATSPGIVEQLHPRAGAHEGELQPSGTCTRTIVL